MELKINVDESQFKEIVEKELEALQPEEIHEILSQGIGEYLRSDNYAVIKKLIFNENTHGYSNKTPSDFVTKAILSCDFSGLQDVVDQWIELIQNNYKAVLREVLLQAMLEGIQHSFNFENDLRFTIQRLINENNMN